MLIPISILAYGSVTWWYFAPQGNTLLSVADEAIYGNNTNNQNSQWRCITYTGLGNHTLYSIQGTISSMRLFTSPSDDLTFNQVLITYMITDHVLNSGSGNYLNSPCYDESGHKIDGSEFGDGRYYAIGGTITQLVGRYSETVPISYVNLNYTIPSHQNIVFLYNYGTGSSPPSQMYVQTQLTLTLK